MPMDPQELGRLRDLTTGYEIVITRVERADYGIEYEMAIFEPNPEPGTDGMIDSNISIPFKSDGTGFLPILPTQG